MNLITDRVKSNMAYSKPAVTCSFSLPSYISHHTFVLQLLHPHYLAILWRASLILIPTFYLLTFYFCYYSWLILHSIISTQLGCSLLCVGTPWSLIPSSVDCWIVLTTLHYSIQQTLCKGPESKYFGFVGYRVFDATTQICICNLTAALNIT